MSKKRWVVLLTVLFTLLWLILPASAEEAAAAYSISGYRSDVTLYSDGSVYFDEYITYRMLQESAEIVKPIPMSNASGIEGLEVLRQEPAVPESEEVTPELTALTQSDSADGGNGDIYTYTLADKDEDVYHISIPVQGKKREEKTFVFRYKLKDTVFLYKDTAAFFWQFIMPQQDIDARNVQIQITLPIGISVDEIKGFVSGSPYASKEVLEDGTFRITAERIKPDETLETALLIPKSLFPDGRKIIDNFAEDAIISDMTSWEGEALRAKKKDELRFYGGWAVAILSVLLSLGTGLLLYLKAGRKPKLPVLGEVKGLPAGAWTPAELGVLLNRGKVGARDLFSTVLHLIQSGYLELQFNEKREGSLALKEGTLRDKLLPHEEYVLNWLTKDLGNGRALLLDDLEELLRNYSRQGGHKVSTWETLIRQRAAKRKFEEKITRSKAWGMGAVLIGLLAALLAGLVLGNIWAGILSAAFALALAGYIIPLKKRSDFGWMQAALWQQFREYLRGQLSGPGSELSMFVWEQYLVYAVPLGVAQEILEKLPHIFRQSAFEDGNLTVLYGAHHAWLMDMLTKIK